MNKYTAKNQRWVLLFMLAFFWLIGPDLQAQDSPATKLLKARTIELREDVIQIGEDVYCAVGYSPANVTMIIGDDGIIIVDTGMAVDHAERILAEFRNITDKPIKAVILTHGHGDHTGGLSVFIKDGSPQVWARDNFNEETHSFTDVGLTYNGVRGARQGGFKLPPEKRINNGIAPAMYPKRKGNLFNSESKKGEEPTHTFSEDRKKIQIAGVDLELVAALGETHDHLYVWLPKQRVLCSGDNFYQSWPNLYTIRGSAYRDVRAWANSHDKMLKEGAEFLIPGHTRPIIGKDKVATVLTDYRDAINFVFDKTIEGMNKGLTPDELVDYVQLPERFTEKDYLRPYYGHPEWAVRAIFEAHLGWFDGNPTHLFSLPLKEEAQHMADLAGGQDKLLAKACDAVEQKDYQWAAQLADHLIALQPEAAEPKLIKADALDGLGENLLTATGRNYYLTVAQELRQAAEKSEPIDESIKAAPHQGMPAELTSKLDGKTLVYQYIGNNKYKVTFENDQVSYLQLKGPRAGTGKSGLAYHAREVRPGLFYVGWHGPNPADHVAIILDLNQRYVYSSVSMRDGQMTAFHEGIIESISTSD